jgi:hypothetical protein
MDECWETAFRSGRSDWWHRRALVVRTQQYGTHVNFTALHRLLGRQPGPLLDDMLDEAVGQHLE